VGARVRPGCCVTAPTWRTAWRDGLTRAGKDGALVEGTCPRKAGRRRSFTAWLDAGSIPAGSITLSSCTPAACEAEAMPTHIGETYPPHRSHRGGLHRAGVARPHCTFRNQGVAFSLLRGGGALRAQRVEVHVASSVAQRAAGVRAVASRLLAHLEDLRQRRGSVEHRQLVRRRNAVHVGHLEQRCALVGRLGAARALELGDRAAAAQGADPRCVLRGAASRQLGRLAEHIASVRAEVAA